MLHEPWKLEDYPDSDRGSLLLAPTPLAGMIESLMNHAKSLNSVLSLSSKITRVSPGRTLLRIGSALDIEVDVIV